ncbi:MAG: polyphosphate kinase 1 [Planctomycetes bacterium]|nr:polyphosphate kinase 1 [Planctomycetota bacterium]
MSQPARDLRDPSLYLNRELSSLEFNARVLEQAKDPTVPLLERLRFLSISSTNLDEFFEIRVSGLKQQIAHGATATEADGLSPEQTMHAIGEAAHALVAEQYRVFNEVLLPELARAGIKIWRRGSWTPRQEKWVRRFFVQDVLPVLTPVGLDPAHPFPRVLNKSLNFIVSLQGQDAFGRTSGIAVVQVPRSLPRLIPLKGGDGGGHDFVLLSSIVHAHIGEVFPGLEVTGCWQFRLTRNSDLWVDEEETDDLMRTLKGELTSRNFGETVRLEVAKNCPEEMAQYLLSTFELEAEDLYRVDGIVNLHRVAAMYDMVARPELKYPPFMPRVPRRIEEREDVFEALRKGDVLLHHPYDSFSPVVEFLRQAASDPHVLAIKQTLYRTGADSPIVDALIEAARGGKEVTVVVELRARFDEAANINLATRLQAAGASVVYGIVGYKAHTKMLLVVRREGHKLRRYVHLGTGNYHSKTSRAYTDVGFLTCDRAIGEDVHKLFNQLTGLGKVGRLKRVLQSPFTLHKALVGLIEREAKHATAGRSARIVAKMNSLTEPRIIQALYRASQAGVSIDLVVRGICCLRPGVPGVSESIRVRSIVGRFLEHSRIFYFENDGEPQYFCASADWMQRNFFWRVETCFPVDDQRLRQRIWSECLEPYLVDNVQSWLLGPDGKYRRARPGKERPRVAQEFLLERLCGLTQPEFDADRLEQANLVVEVGPRERVVVEPPLRKRKLEGVASRRKVHDRKRLRTPTPIEPHREPEQDGESQEQASA